MGHWRVQTLVGPKTIHLFGKQSLVPGLLNAVGDGRGQPQEILGIPCVDDLGLGLECPVSEDRVIDRPASKTGRGRRFRYLKILLLVESYDRQPFPDVAEEQQRFVPADVVLGWACPVRVT